MSIIAPSTTVTLYHDVPITDEKNLIFKNISNQRSYFAGKVYRTSVECSYERAGAPLMLDIPISDMYKFNYISFKNEAFENKEIYARPLPPVYINNEVLAVPYVIDYWQTFMFDIKMDKCGILRQHPTVGEKTDYETNPLAKFHALLTPEPITYSDALRAHRNSSNAHFLPIMRGRPYGLAQHPESPVLCVQTTQYLDDVSDKIKTNEPKYDSNTNFPTAVVNKYFTCDNSGLQALKNYLNDFTENGMVSSILGIYYVPAIMMKASSAEHMNENTESPVTPSDFDRWNVIDEWTISIPTSGVDKKLLHYPYCYIRVSDFLGNSKEYRIDRFNSLLDKTVTFGIFYTMNGYPQVILAPKNYMGSYPNTGSISFGDIDRNAYNFEEKMVITDFPQVGYNTDGYLAWVGSVFRQQGIKDTTAGPWTYNGVMRAGGAVAKSIGNMLSSGIQGASNGGLAGGVTALIGSGATQVADLWGESLNFKNERALHEAASKYFEDPLAKDFEVPDYMADAIPMFAKDDYHAGGSTCGLPACMFDKMGFLVEIITPYEEEQIIYSRFFDKYGYSQNVIETPSAYDYTRNVGNSDYNPTFNSEGLTFVKTDNCSVEGANIEVTSAIEQMFNGGHWFSAPDNT